MKNVCLAIIDGFGVSETQSNADATLEATFLKQMAQENPYQEIFAHGEYVGLLENMVGNSEVGHMTIGAGRVVDQSIKMINEAYVSGRLKEAVHSIPKLSGRVHLIGLASDAGVHGHIDHFRYLAESIPPRHQVFTHAIADGIDVPPNTAAAFISRLSNVVSVSGRYYAMDRDKNWDRTEKTFVMMTRGKKKELGIHELCCGDDEFIEPTLIRQEHIEPGDTVIMLNYRADRARQLHSMLKEHCVVYTVTAYDDSCERALLRHKEVRNTLSECLSKRGLRQAHVAETEKYAHVTYFFNGGRELQFINEQRFVVPSPRVPNFALAPETSMAEVAGKCIESMEDGAHFIVANFAAPDLVGHTGDFEKTVVAVKAMDREIERLFRACISRDYVLIVTGDHGNAEQMTENGNVCKSHTRNKVPLIIANTGRVVVPRKNASLKDIAPTILRILDAPIPEEMTGAPLLE